VGKVATMASPVFHKPSRAHMLLPPPAAKSTREI
jgi:hypothetical protein